MQVCRLRTAIRTARLGWVRGPPRVLAHGREYNVSATDLWENQPIVASKSTDLISERGWRNREKRTHKEN
jgi:hypothetical protein